MPRPPTTTGSTGAAARARARAAVSIHPASLLLPLSLLLSLLLTTPAAAKASTPTTTMAATRARAAFHLLPSTGATHRHRHSTLRMLLHPAQTPNIRLVASDVDGTLLTTAHTIAPRTVQAIRRMVQEKGVLFVPATGKSRGGVRNALGALGRELTGPPGPSREGKGGLWGVGGVYLQGLIVYKGEEVVFERTLETDIALDGLRFARERGVSIIAFSGDRILCEKMDATIASVTTQHEPMPEVAPLPGLISHGAQPIHKLILMGPPAQITALRPALQEFVGTRATLTQAQADMVEVLPPGASKGAGVVALLQALEVDPAHVLAIGDAENDVEMLKLAGVPVAMGNAPAHIQSLAKHVAPTNDEDGAAQAFERLVLGL